MKLLLAAAVVLLVVPTASKAQETSSPTQSKPESPSVQPSALNGGKPRLLLIGPLRAPHIGEENLVVRLDQKNNTSIHTWLFAAADPDIKTLYYLPTFVQLDAAPHHYERDPERIAGKTIYSFWVGVPPQFDDARDKQFRQDRKTHPLPSELMATSSASVVPKSMTVESVIPNYATALESSQPMSLVDFLIEVSVPTSLAMSFDKALYEGSISVNYRVTMHVSGVTQSQMVRFSCKDVASNLGLKGAGGHAFTLAQIRIALNSAKQVNYKEYRNIPAQSAEAAFDKIAKDCNFNAKQQVVPPATGSSSGAHSAASSDETPSNKQWTLALDGEISSDKHTDIEVGLEDSPLDQALTIRLQGGQPTPRQGVVDSSSERWQLVRDLDLRAAVKYRLAVAGQWRILLGDGIHDIGACATTALTSLLPSGQVLKLERQKPLALVLRFTPKDGRNVQYLDFCDSDPVDFMPPKKGKLEALINAPLNSYESNKGALRISVRALKDKNPT
jgi:hypothetical protein